MNTVLGSFRHLWGMSDKVQVLWGIGILLVLLVLAVLHHKWRDDEKKLRIWKLLCLLPLVMCVLHFVLYAWGAPNLGEMVFGYYLMLYLVGALALIPIPFAKRKIGYPIAATLTGILTVLCGAYYSVAPPTLKNASKQSYTESFHTLAAYMDEKYILKEWKEADFAAMEAKYLPMVEEAEAEQNPGKFEDAVWLFLSELHDGHVWMNECYDTEQYPSAYQRKEYGFTTVLLDDGTAIAVCTTEEAQKCGIQEGTVITKWNGKPILQAAQEDTMDRGIPVKENADRIAVMHLSHVGGETIEVTYLDDTHKEKTVTLQELDTVQTLSKAIEGFANLDEASENFSTRMLDDKCGYLVLNAEGTDSDVQDILGYLAGNHKWAREMFRERLRDLKSQGMEYLVIDLRNNMGGMDEIGCALCDLLTTEDWFGQGLGVRKNGEYTIVSEHGIHGDGEFADLQVVALTNFNCVSAGDGTSLYLSKLPNVTLAGMTDPNGCNQETGGCCILSQGLVSVYFPVGLILNEDGEPNVDTTAERISRNPVEERIPFDEDAAKRIFTDHEDYELHWAMDYLKSHLQ